MTSPPKLPPASISLHVDLLDTLTPAGRGKRVDATFTDSTGERKRRIEVVADPKPTPTRRRRKP